MRWTVDSTYISGGVLCIVRRDRRGKRKGGSIPNMYLTINTLRRNAWLHARRSAATRSNTQQHASSHAKQVCSHLSSPLLPLPLPHGNHSFYIFTIHSSVLTSLPYPISPVLPLLPLSPLSPLSHLSHLSPLSPLSPLALLSPLI